MNAEYKEHLFLSEMRAKGLIEDTKSKAEEKATFERIATLFKFWLIESKKCTEESFHDALNEDNFRDWKDSQWRVKNLPIVIELIGTNDLHSQVIKIGHIKKVLSAHKLTPSEAIDLLEDIGKEAHSPSFYKKVISEIVKHLEQLISRPSERKSADEVDDKSNPQEPINPFKRIFVNGYAYEMFEKLRIELTEEFPNESLSNYSFIMQRMKEKKYLLENNHPTLIKFIDDNFNQKIGEKYFQFTNPTPKVKMQRFKRLNNEYQSKIEAILK